MKQKEVIGNGNAMGTTKILVANSKGEEIFKIKDDKKQFKKEEDKKEILIEHFRLMGYNQSTNNTSNEDSALTAD